MGDDFKNEFGWSSSRGRLYKKCKRAYWLRYYGSWDGWAKGAHPGKRIAYRLGKMNSLIPWSGNVVHDVVQRAATRLSKKLRVTLDDAKGWARAAMVKGWREARSADWADKPKKFLNLGELYYEGETEEVVRKAGAARDRVNTALEHWWEMGWPEMLWDLGVDDWIELEGLSKIRFRDSVDIYVQPDLAFWREGLLMVVDWKTGKAREADSTQVKIYVIWAMKRGFSLEKIRSQLVYLGASPQEKTAAYTMDQMRLFADVLWEDIEEVRRNLYNREHNVARAEDFPMTEDRSDCKWCEYRQLCHGRGDAPGPARAHRE